MGVRGQELIKDRTIEVSKWTAASFAAVAVMAIVQMTSPSAAEPPNARGDQVQIDQGKVTYAQKCSHCHGPNMVNSGTITPDLRGFPDDKAQFLHHGEAGQERQDAAVGRHPER